MDYLYYCCKKWLLWCDNWHYIVEWYHNLTQNVHWKCGTIRITTNLVNLYVLPSLRFTIWHQILPWIYNHSHLLDDTFDFIMAFLKATQQGFIYIARLFWIRFHFDSFVIAACCNTKLGKFVVLLYYRQQCGDGCALKITF